MPNPVPLQPNQFYHLYNRGNNRENIFREERNYRYFLQLYAQYIAPVAHTFAYCLLRNHFHVLIKTRDQDLTGVAKAVRSNSNPISQAFSNFFNAYARAYNRMYERTGALFERPFGRILVTTQPHLLHLVTYIHQNPQRHGLVTDFREWPYSSYHSLLSSLPSKLQREEVLSWFQSSQSFVEAHRPQKDLLDLPALAPDDFD